MSVTKESGTVRPERRGWTRWSFVLGVLTVVSFVAGFVAVNRLWPGDPSVIGIATTLHYVIPLAGVVVGHVARRREGAQWESTLGLVLCYLCLITAVVPVLIGLAGLLIAF